MDKRTMSVMIRNTVLGLMIAGAVGLHAVVRAQDASGVAAAPAAGVKAFDAVAVTQQAWTMARSGKLDEVLRGFGSMSDMAVEADPLLVSLRAGARQHVEHEAARRAAAQAEIDKKLDTAVKQFEEGKLVKSLTTVLQAKGLAVDAEAFLANAKIKPIIAAGEKAAARAEIDANWLEALDLYRRLQLLFDDREHFEEEVDRVIYRASLLRNYTPEGWYALSVDHAKKNGEEIPEKWNNEGNTWKERVKGVSLSMLRDSLTRAVREHVESATYEKLLLGGVQSLRVLLTTKGLEATFPSLAVPDKVNPFLAHLSETELALRRRKLTLSDSEAYRILLDLMTKNNETVDLPDEVVVHEFAYGAMKKLDEFSSIIWPHDVMQFQRTMAGKFTGVGIQISLVDRKLTVVTPLDNSPALKAGIKSGQRIVSIDGKSTAGIDLDTAVERITGPEGTEVTLGIAGTDDADDAEPRQVTLVRTEIPIRSVKGWERRGGDWDYLIDPQARIGYIRMSSFGPDTADDMDKAVQAMTAEKPLNGLILDLRFNPGGLLSAAIGVADRFLEGGTIVSTAAPAGGPDRPRVYAADTPNTYKKFPLIVLINRGSASASEIVSGALQAHGRALVVGHRSFGKGSVQDVFPLFGRQAYLKLTTKYYMMPDGKIIHRRPGQQSWGIEPDVNVPMTEDEFGDMIQARMLLDILVDENEQVNPDALISKRRTGDEEDQPKDRPRVNSADELLAKGMDPQLDVALLLLRAKALGQAGG